VSAPRRGHGRRGGHEEEHEEHENHERWLVSYADMMTLLMVLFIVMFAISSINQGKFDQLKQGLHKGFGTPQTMMAGGADLLESGNGVAPDPPQIDAVAEGGAGGVDVNSWKPATPKQAAGPVKGTPQAQVREEVENLKKAEEALKAALAKAGIPRGATFRFDERGLVVTIATDKVLFESGSAVLRRQGRLILDTIEPTLAKLPNRISVDGHTNSLPIATDRFPSNWELSTDRATGVLRYLARPRGIGVDRMSAAGYADTRPLLPVSDARAVVVNRRVEIVVLAGVDDSLGRAVAQLGQGKQSSANTPGTTWGDTPGRRRG
jgi:chemotaxis protein MotB